MKLNFSGPIIGGPHDGDNLRYEGELLPGKPMEGLMGGALTIEFEGHTYKIKDFNYETNSAVFEY